MSKPKYNILPCPHCGGPAKLSCSKSRSEVCYMYVRCIVCGATGKTLRLGTMTPTEEAVKRNAICAWNMRTPLRDPEDADQDPETVDQNESSDQLETFVFKGPDVETVEHVETVKTDDTM